MWRRYLDTILIEYLDSKGEVIEEEMIYDAFELIEIKKRLPRQAGSDVAYGVRWYSMTPAGTYWCKQKTVE